MSTQTANNVEVKDKDLRLFNVVTGLFVTILILSATTSTKIFAVGPFTLPGGIILFPIAYIFNDLLTETYGFARARRVIWTGFACQILASLTYLLVDKLPPAPFWHNQEAFSSILGFAPRIFVASLVAYFCGEFVNSFIL